MPWWDPYAAGGQPVYPDALNQLFFLPVVLFRVALPAIVGFNLMVVTPFPLAALGAWLFLRRRFSPLSAAIGAAVFADERAGTLHQQLSEHVMVHRLDPLDAVGGRSRSPHAVGEQPGDPLAARRRADALGRTRDHGRHRGARSGVCDVLRQRGARVPQSTGRGRTMSGSDRIGGPGRGRSTGADGRGGRAVASRCIQGRQLLVAASPVAHRVAVATCVWERRLGAADGDAVDHAAQQHSRALLLLDVRRSGRYCCSPSSARSRGAEAGAPSGQSSRWPGSCWRSATIPRSIPRSRPSCRRCAASGSR